MVDPKRPSNDVAVAASSSSTKLCGPTRQEWKFYQPLIQDLYCNKGYTAGEVAEELSQRVGRTTTEGMVKKRIRAWGYPTYDVSTGRCATCLLQQYHVGRLLGLDVGLERNGVHFTQKETMRAAKTLGYRLRKKAGQDDLHAKLDAICDAFEALKVEAESGGCAHVSLECPSRHPSGASNKQGTKVPLCRIKRCISCRSNHSVQVYYTPERQSRCLPRQLIPPRTTSLPNSDAPTNFADEYIVVSHPDWPYPSITSPIIIPQYGPGEVFDPEPEFPADIELEFLTQMEQEERIARDLEDKYPDEEFHVLLLPLKGIKNMVEIKVVCDRCTGELSVRKNVMVRIGTGDDEDKIALSQMSVTILVMEVWEKHLRFPWHLEKIWGSPVVDDIPIPTVEAIDEYRREVVQRMAQNVGLSAQATRLTHGKTQSASTISTNWERLAEDYLPEDPGDDEYVETPPVSDILPQEEWQSLGTSDTRSRRYSWIPSQVEWDLQDQSSSSSATIFSPEECQSMLCYPPFSRAAQSFNKRPGTPSIVEFPPRAQRRREDALPSPAAPAVSSHGPGLKQKQPKTGKLRKPKPPPKR